MRLNIFVVLGLQLFASSMDASVLDLRFLPTASLLWQFNHNGVDSFGPLLADGLLFFTVMNKSPGADYEYQLYCLNATVGIPIWSFKIPAPASAAGKLRVFENTLYVIFDGTIRALSPQTGESLWNQSVANVSVTDMLLSGSSAYLGVTDQRDPVKYYIYMMDLGSRQIMWKSPPADWPDGFYSEMATDGDNVFAVSTYIGTRSLLSNVTSFHGGSGEILWQTALDTPFSYGILASDGFVWATASTGHVCALHSSSGALLWQTPTPVNDQIDASPVYADGALFYGSEANVLSKLDSISGKSMWKIAVPGPITSSVSVLGGVVSFGTENIALLNYVGIVNTIDGSGSLFPLLEKESINGGVILGKFSGDAQPVVYAPASTCVYAISV